MLRRFFLETRFEVHENQVVKFYVNLNVLEDNVASFSIYGVEFVFDNVFLGEVLHVPTVFLVEYVWEKDKNFLPTPKFTQGRVTTRPRKVLKGEEMMYELVHKEELPRGEDVMMFTSALLSFGNLLTNLFKAFINALGKESSE
ncbi:hypothetical protein RDI58_022276 [Solanum bulbocastanum]|uniref:Uncharacterized protein n=1 Tax=Solanum bulbocastanum TaxID=147425 RepID=A0AAN8T7P7_SOLBU